MINFLDDQQDIIQEREAADERYEALEDAVLDVLVDIGETLDVEYGDNFAGHRKVLECMFDVLIRNQERVKELEEKAEVL
jgi:hypothetical protein